ncbi:MAG: FAD-dependent oxidoreductase [Firmicutes bacterium]|nr:FAD-dependent oxidoreductase [Bacillota bacterium]
MHNVVVLGSRFGGSATAYWLSKLFERREITVTIVDQWTLMTYRPALVRVAAGHPAQADNWHIPMVRRYQRAGFRFIRDTAYQIDPRAQKIHLATHPPLPYDTVFVATGADPAWEAIDGLGPHHGGVCEDYLARQTGYALSKTAGPIVVGVGPLYYSGSPVRLRASLDVPALEVAFLLDAWLRKHRRRQDIPITVITPACVPGESLGPKSQAILTRELERRQIQLIAESKVEQVGDSHITLYPQRVIKADQMIWIPPYHGSQLARRSGLDDGWGWIPTDKYCRHEKWSNVYAVGDINRSALPKLGHIAMLQAKVAVHALWAAMHHKSAQPFTPFVLHVIWTGHGRGLFTLSDILYGGKRDWVYFGAPASLAKTAFNASYRFFSGWMPIMP